jgi:hypothetical protein
MEPENHLMKILTVCTNRMSEIYLNGEQVNSITESRGGPGYWHGSPAFCWWKI